MSSAMFRAKQIESIGNEVGREAAGAAENRGRIDRAPSHIDAGTAAAQGGGRNAGQARS